MFCQCSNAPVHMSAAASSILGEKTVLTPNNDCAGHTATHEQGGKNGSAAKAGAGPCLESGTPDIAVLYCSTSGEWCVVDLSLLRARCWKQRPLLSRPLLFGDRGHEGLLLSAGMRISRSQSSHWQ